MISDDSCLRRIPWFLMTRMPHSTNAPCSDMPPQKRGTLFRPVQILSLSLSATNLLVAEHSQTFIHRRRTSDTDVHPNPKPQPPNLAPSEPRILRTPSGGSGAQSAVRSSVSRGGFDWLDLFKAKNPQYIELSDRMIMDWAEKSRGSDVGNRDGRGGRRAGGDVWGRVCRGMGGGWRSEDQGRSLVVVLGAQSWGFFCATSEV